MTTTFSEAISRQPLKSFSIMTFVVCMLVLTYNGLTGKLETMSDAQG